MQQANNNVNMHMTNNKNNNISNYNNGTRLKAYLQYFDSSSNTNNTKKQETMQHNMRPENMRNNEQIIVLFLARDT